MLSNIKVSGRNITVHVCYSQALSQISQYILKNKFDDAQITHEYKYNNKVLNIILEYLTIIQE